MLIGGRVHVTSIISSGDRASIVLSAIRQARLLAANKSGLALIEFAFSLPIFIGLGFYGVEIANLAVTQMKMSQIALNMADNASRIGTLNSSLGAKVINEAQINDIFQAASIQAGAAGIYQDGRTVLSSLEVNADGGQTIMWQRCKGILFEDSIYGPQGTGASGTGFAGMGPSGDKISASVGTAVMYVELTYVYDPLFGSMFMEKQELRQEAAYTVRDAREIGKPPTNNVSSARQSTCNKYDAILPQTSDAQIAAAQSQASMPGYSSGNNPNNPDQGLCVAGLICVKA
jgi:hypothetical protein